MKTIIRISEVLFQKFGFYVPISEIGYESHTFYREEIWIWQLKNDVIGI